MSASTWANTADYWGPDACVTAGPGMCSYGFGTAPNDVASLTFVVDDVGHATHSYDPAANADPDPDGDSDGTTITVNQP